MTILDHLHIHSHPIFHPCSRRLHLLLLLMFGYFSMAIMTSNIGITLSCMVNTTAVAAEENEIHDGENESLPLIAEIHNLNMTSSCKDLIGKAVIDYGGSFDWSVKIQGYIVGATFFGGMLATFPAGYAIDHYSNRHLLLASVMLLSFATLLLPLAAENFGPEPVIFLRFLMGIGEGIMIPGLNGMVTKWIPLHEKSTGASLYTSGNQLAGMIGNPVAASLCESPLKWNATFYLTGSLGILWAILWLLTVKNTPSKSKWISQKEAAYLEHHLPKKPKQKKIIPWKAMLTSPAVLTLIYSSITANMMLALVLVYIPVYFKDVLYMDVQTNGFYASIPHFVNLLSKLGWSILMDNLKQKKILTPTQACKLSQGIAMAVISISFLGLAFFVDCSKQTSAIVLLCFVCGGFGLCISGFLTSLLSISPYYIGILSSVTQMIGFGGRIATPQLITMFKTTGTADEWQKILLVYAAITALCGVIFVIWGSGEVEAWNYHMETTNSCELVDKSLLPGQERTKDSSDQSDQKLLS